MKERIESMTPDHGMSWVEGSKLSTGAETCQCRDEVDRGLEGPILTLAYRRATGQSEHSPSPIRQTHWVGVRSSTGQQVHYEQ